MVCCAAHPRSRGENGRERFSPFSPRGSSPLTRGKLRQAPILQGGRRLIPAHAGKTAPAPTSHTSRRAHPRSRGENHLDGDGRHPERGSSPLTRGKQPASVYLVFMVGLIPAHAGKTPRRRRGGWTSGAHPRSRGENTSELLLCWARERLIPAHAGKTRRSRRIWRSSGAHPRSRGENILIPPD